MKVKTGERYRHYKGKEYTVLMTGRHSETLEEMVVYQANYTDETYGAGAVWVRPLSLFCSTVEYKGATVPRFLLLP